MSESSNTNDSSNSSNSSDFSEIIHELIQSQQTFSPLANDVIGHSVVCPCCQELVDDLEIRRRHTYYTNEEANWIVACAECQRVDAEHWEDMWQDYWSSVR